MQTKNESKKVELRVFRRNFKNLVILWSKKELLPHQQEKIEVFLIKEGPPKSLIFYQFIPINPDKFEKETMGVVIPHSNNNISPSQEIIIEIRLGDQAKERIVERIKVQPFKKFAIKEKKLYLYGYEKASKTWKPLEVIVDATGKSRLLVA